MANENNNTLKTKSYNFKHNFGHGKQHLSSLLASLNILAFLVHTVLEWFDLFIFDFPPPLKIRETERSEVMIFSY
jgi:divalent metal cation (Fe/Co/Zn/Cd) transporter